MSVEDQLQELKQDLEELEREMLQKKAVLDNLMEELKELGYSTLEEAEQGLTELRQTLKEVEDQAQMIVSEIKEKYSDFIE